MKKSSNTPLQVRTVPDLHRLLGLPQPEHPLISLIRFEAVSHLSEELSQTYSLGFYSIWLKRNFIGKMKYGQNDYDFDDGIMSFFSPGQVIGNAIKGELSHKGWWLIIHPDFLWHYPLAKIIKGYSFFSYTVYEALHLSEKEEVMISDIFNGIQNELQQRIDDFSQNVIVSQTGLLLNYADRFYHRQFITRKIINHDLISRLITLLDDYFESDKVHLLGLPSVKFIAENLHISSNYLSDLMRLQNGISTQHYIQDKVIERAKLKLSTTSLTVAEIAYGLGFGHSQSFSKLFKQKTSLSPVQFRQSFN